MGQKSVMEGRGAPPALPPGDQARREEYLSRRERLRQIQEEQEANSGVNRFRSAAAFGVRGASALVPGAWPGAIAGAVGEGLGQVIEPGLLEGRKPFNFAQVGTQGALGAVPFGRVGTVGRTALKGGVMGAGSALATQQAEEGWHVPDADDARAAAFGATFGAAGGAIAAKARNYFNTRKPGDSTEPDSLEMMDTRPGGPPDGGGPPRIPQRTSAPRYAEGEIVDEYGEPFVDGQVVRPNTRQPLPADRQITSGPGQGEGFNVSNTGADLGHVDDLRSAALAELRAYRADPGSFDPRRAQALADNLTRHIGTPNALDTAAGIYEALPASFRTSPYTREMSNKLSSLPDHLAARARREQMNSQRTVQVPERAPEINRDQAIRTRAQGTESLDEALTREQQPKPRSMFGRPARPTLGGRKIRGQQPQGAPNVEPVNPKQGLQDVQPVQGDAPGGATSRPLARVTESTLTNLAKKGEQSAINELKARGIWDRIKLAFTDETGAIGDVAGARERRAAQFSDMEARQSPADRAVSERRVTELAGQFSQGTTARHPPDTAVSESRFGDLLAKLGGRQQETPSLGRGVIKSGELSPDYQAKLRARDSRSPEQILRDVLNEMSGGRSGGVLDRLKDETGAVGGDITGMRVVHKLEPDEWADLADSIDDEIIRAGGNIPYQTDLRKLQQMIREKMPAAPSRMRGVEPMSSFGEGTGRSDVPSTNRSGLADRLKSERGAVNLQDIKESITGKSAGLDDTGPSYLKEDLTVSMNEELRRMGPAGEEIFRRLAKADHLEQQYNARWANKYKEATQNLTDEEIENLVDVIEKGVKAKTPAVKAAVPVVRQVFSDIGDEAAKRGVTYVTGGGKKIPFVKHGPDYWPRVPKEKGQSLIDKLMKGDGTGPGLTRAEAQKIERLYREYGELLLGSQHQRLNRIFDYKKTRDVAQLHIEGMSRLISRTRTIGAKDIAGTADGIAKLIEATPDPARTLELLKRHLGREEKIRPGVTKAIRMARTYAVWTKLQNFAIANVLGGQQNIILRSDFKTYAKEVMKYLSRDAEQGAIASEAGALAEVSHGMLEEMSKFNPTRLYGIKMTENVNRTIAAGVGRGMANEYFQALKKDPTNALARKRLFELALENVDALLKQPKLTEDQLRIAAGRMAEITQGLNVKRNVPHGWASDHPAVQMMTIFKKYAFQGSKATWDAIKENPGRNLPLFLAIGQLTGMTIGAAKSTSIGAWRSLFEGENPADTISEEVSGRDDYVGKNFGIENKIAARVLDNAFQSFAFGIPADIIQAAAQSRTGLMEMVAGPLPGDATRLGHNVMRGARGEGESALKDVGRMAARSAPLPMGGGQALAKQFNEEEGSRDRGPRRRRRQR